MKYEKLATEIGKLVDEKNAAYGSSFQQAGEFLRLLYPNGIPPEKYGDMLCVVRIFDKLKRIATKKGAFSESPYQDIVGYGLLGTAMDQETMEHSSLGIPEETVREALNENLGTASTFHKLEDPEVPVMCSICGKFVANIKQSQVAAGQKYAHDFCYHGSKPEKTS